ncbi:DNA-directed DNA polymerase theta [Xylona heveae TC161]|uniref:DNA-directed DNA polymerase theta n=1 Tax=Xylona heveae (strain CBS 132557 / TC161) TaxID=1328760 RepID=A0A165J9W2_XYLHT|nr:DNA-directed DNA polymerase theta [Xylona heveae TC161]KZF25949.1 DNA-directed DNA polymerase theta [Xylona heveae TC161]
MLSQDLQGITEYSQRRGYSSTPGPSQNPLLSLSHSRYGLPERLVQNFYTLGVRSIYPWQMSCLMGRGLLEGEKNLVYTAPTGGGKSLVADVLMLKRIIDNPGQKAILVLPYVALVQEKSRWLRNLVEGVEKTSKNGSQEDLSRRRWRRRGDEESIRVVGLFGGSVIKSTWDDMDIAVCTIEKANSLVNSIVEECTADRLGVVVMDELHMIDDDHRGYLLELMATKLLTMGQNVQIIGMSATLPNTELLARWLGSKFYQSRYRPIPIEEYLVYDNAIYPASTSSNFLKTASQLSKSGVNVSLEQCRIIQPSEHIELKDPVNNAVVALALETVQAGYGVLVFCGSRKGCETDAALISEAMPIEEVSEDILNKRTDVIHDLRNTAAGLDMCLEKTIPRGVGFHHAGLTTEERDIIANAYDQGVIKVIVATCSLAAGVNLPARRVILHGARMGRDFIGPAMLRQMRGRAGRKGKDELGEAYICCRSRDIETVAQLMEANLPVLKSCLKADRRGIKRALLEVITTRLATDPEALNEYVRRTLLYHEDENGGLDKFIGSTLDELVEAALIAMEPDGTFNATQLGQATVASSLAPEDGLFVHAEIQRALRAFVMDGEMHVFYMFTPIQTAGLADVNWAVFRDEVDKLDESGLRVLQYVGVKPGVVNRCANLGASLKERTQEEQAEARIYRRFYAAFQLRDICNEMPVYAVAKKYDVPRGMVQNLAQTCQGFAAGMIKFCQRMGWGMLAAVLDHMSDRLSAGARADLLDLARVTFVKSRTARVFWENGIRSVRMLADSEPKELIPILLQAQPRKVSLRDAEEEDKYQKKLIMKAEIIIHSAQRLYEQDMQVELEE